MKLNKFFLFSAAVGLALASCSDDVDNRVDNGKDVKGDTYVSLSVELAAQGGTRAAGDEASSEAGEFVGEGGERKVAKLRFLLADEKLDMTYVDNTYYEGLGIDAMDGESFYKWNATTDSYVTGIWETQESTAAKAMNIILNAPGEGAASKTAVDAARALANTEIDTKDNLAMIADFASADGFTMTGAKKSYPIFKKTKQEVYDGSKPADNNFQFDVKRVLSKGIVVYNIADGDETVKAGTVTLGKIAKDADKITFSGKNGATKFYLFDGEGKSAIAGSTYAASPADAATQGLFRMSNLATQYADKNSKQVSEVKNEDLAAAYQAKKAVALAGGFTAATQLEGKAGVYFFENTADSYTGDNMLHGYDRFATAKVYVTFTPAEVYSYDDADFITKEAYEALDDATVEQTLGKDAYRAVEYKSDATNKTTVYLKKVAELKKNTSYEVGKTYVLGQQTGKFYANKQSAIADNNTTAVTYANGRGGYQALWNVKALDDQKNPTNAETWRNSIYVLEINGFTGIPFAWDPSDPNDPNLPETPGDDKPNVDDNPGQGSATYMRVKATVLNWKVSKRKVNLGEY
mgnify:FL=1